MPKINFRDREIWYHDEGDGPVVVLVHGFGENSDVFRYQRRFLKKNYRVISPDLPGSGRSDLLPGEPSLDDFAAVVYHIVQKEIPARKFCLLGHSMGGYTTMAFVEKHTPLLNGFGLIHSSAYADTTEKIEIREKGIHFVEAHGGQAFLKTITPGLFSEKSRNSHKELQSELLALAEGISDEAIIGYYRAMIARPDRSELLRSTPLPVFFAVGREDIVISFSLSMKQIKLTKKPTVCILEDSGHMGLWEEWEKTNGALKKFLDDVCG